MSGPIVRRYGFANFEKIFGEKPLQHGIEDDEPAGGSEEANPASKPKVSRAKGAGGAKKKASKKSD